jgi:D-alanine transaminase
MIVFFNGNFIQEDEVRISQFDRGFQFADGVYEVMRTYNKKIFKMEEHLKRLEFSLKEIRIQNFDVADIREIITKLISANKLQQDINIYIQITRGASFPRKHSFPSEKIDPTVYVSAYPLILTPEENENGIKIILKEDIRWTRCNIKSISLLPSVLANQAAKENGAAEALFMRAGIITEGSHTNVFAVKDKVIFTPPLSNFILSGITREVIIEICSKNSIELKETNIQEKELKNFDEFFITGTTTEIKPVIQIDTWKVKDGKPGVITRNIQNIFKEYTSNY